MRLNHTFIGLCLIAALFVTPVSAAGDDGGGILQAITDFFFWWLPAAEDPPVTEDPPAAEENFGPGMQMLALETTREEQLETQQAPTPDPTQTSEVTEPTATPTPDPTPVPRVLGTIYAVDYHTVPPYGSAPLMVRFTANESAEIDTYAWDFGDGFSSTERDHFHSYTDPGTYTATLTVSNSVTGWNSTAEITVEVEPPGVVPLPTDEEGMMW